MTETAGAIFVPNGTDRLKEQHGLGVSVVSFKVLPRDAQDIFALENTFHRKGGPARHFHHNQDEWFYIVEGQFIMEVGNERRHMLPGDSLVAPRRVPHVWAFTGEGIGRILITFTPAGLMESFFREIAKTNAMAIQDPALWRTYGMELVGPPLKLE
jgi:quercetin dioxygenase-like cupin family protein